MQRLTPMSLKIAKIELPNTIFSLDAKANAKIVIFLTMLYLLQIT